MARVLFDLATGRHQLFRFQKGAEEQERPTNHLALRWKWSPELDGGDSTATGYQLFTLVSNPGQHAGRHFTQ